MERSLYEAVNNVNDLGEGTLEVGWKFAPDNRDTATRQWKERFARILRGPGRAAIDKAEVRGFDPETGRTETVDLLSDKIVVERSVERARDRLRVVADGSAIEAISDAYALAEAEIRDTATQPRP